jgi:serine/threonine-protein kinase
MFGPYEILARVGDGGMGLVFRAWDERLHREVAIKLLYDEYQMPGIRERFWQEARAASRLNHPNICTVFDIGDKDGDPYLVMELLEGETLRERIHRGALTAEEIVSYTMQICDALEAAHKKGVVHRDIKPANIFLVSLPENKVQVKVLDFGLAKISLEENGGWLSRSLDLTLAGATVGTLSYMSPEQARGYILDARSDLFSLGIVMYEMATRRVPFQGTTSQLIYSQLLQHEPDPIRIWNESIPRDLERIILRLLAKTPEDRFQSAKALRDGLLPIRKNFDKKGWLRKPNLAPVPLVKATDPAARNRKPQRRNADAAPENNPALPENDPTRSLVIRPLRIDVTNCEPSSTAFHPGAMTATFGNAETNVAVAIESGSQVIESAVPPTAEELPHDVRKAAKKTRHLARAASGVNQFELEIESIGSEAKKPKGSAQTAATWRQRVFASVIFLTLAGVAMLLMHSGILHPVLMKPNDILLLTEIENKTSDKMLDGAILKGLEIDLRQSTYLKVRGGAAYLAGRRITTATGSAKGNSVRLAAQNVGARAYIYGDIQQQDNSYIIRADVLHTDSNDRLVSLKETAPTRNELPAAIDRLSRAIRQNLGETDGSIEQHAVPLEKESTANIDALHDYSEAEIALEEGRLEDSIIAYKSAVQRDNHFLQAQMHLAWLYREEGAELASAHAATQAKDAATTRGDSLKLLTDFCFYMNATGDLDKAAETMRTYNERYSKDSDGLIGRSRVLEAQGHFVEALLAAEEGYEVDPYNVEAYDSAELALISLGRYSSVRQLEFDRARLGLPPGRYAAVEEYLANGKRAFNSPSRNSLPSLVSVAYQAIALDSDEDIASATNLRRSVTAKINTREDLASAAASLLAQGAFDAAFAGRCDVVDLLIKDVRTLPRGPEASLKRGLAAAWCGDKQDVDEAANELTKLAPDSKRAAEEYLPELQAAIFLKTKQAPKAIPLLLPASTKDGASFMYYLLGLAYEATGMHGDAAKAFHQWEQHRGAEFLDGYIVATYRMKQ